MILADAHVHIYDCFDLKFFFDHAYKNFIQTALKFGHGSGFTGVLMLAETAHDDWYRYICSVCSDGNKAKQELFGDWTFHRTAENCSLWVSSGDGRSVLLISGRQIVTTEKLEVLALATSVKIRDGRSLKRTVDEVRGCGGIPVIPWGFGKWTGRRRAILARYMKRSSETVFLGDNGGRPMFIPRSSLFRKTDHQEWCILPGSDPLPFPNEGHRAGSFGFKLNGKISKSHPAMDIKEKLLDDMVQIQHYGKKELPHRFLWKQSALHFRKHFKKRKDSF